MAVLIILAMVVPGCPPPPDAVRYNLIMAVFPSGTGNTTPIGRTSHAAGAVVNIAAVANPLFQFVNWTAAAGTFGNVTDPTTTFTMPAQDVVVIANFGRPFRIVRDTFGVPHVFADTKEHLALGAGYAMAQDRLWQADVLRRTASGTLAELLGPGFLAQDIGMRALWYNRTELRAIYDAWDPGANYTHLKPMIEAYVDGINIYISEALDAWDIGNRELMPIEYVAPPRTPAVLKPFTVEDVVAVMVMMAWRFGARGGREGDFHRWLSTLQGIHGNVTGLLIWNELLPLTDPRAPVTIPGAVNTSAPLTMSSFNFPAGLDGLLQQYAESQAAQDALLQSLGMPTRFGSNAVLVGRNKSATGNPLQLGGPQMGYSIPPIVYEIGLHGAGINAVGMAIPALGPFILIGVSEHGAWTSTTGWSDNKDLRILALNPANPLQYWFNGTWRNMTVRNETFQVGVAPNVTTRTLLRSHYGPIVVHDPAANMAITVHVPFFKNEMATEQGWMLFQEATNIAEFEDAVEMIWPTHNFYWADRAGNIGFWHAGRFPVKPAGADRRLPLRGDGTQEWVRITTPAEMPRVINPAQGWLVNWNNKPIANWTFAESDFHWGEGFRVQVLHNALAALAAPGHTVDFTEMNTINQIGAYRHDVALSFLPTLISVVTVHLAATPDPELAAALSHLAAWATARPLPASHVDLVAHWPAPNATYDHPGLTIFDAWYERIVPEVFNATLPPEIIGELRGRPSLLLRVFRNETAFDYLGGRDRNTTIVATLKAAIGDLQLRFGTNMSTWLTPVRMQWYTAVGALPGGNFHPIMRRGTWNHIAEMTPVGQPLRAESVLPPGQSGFVHLVGAVSTPSPHVADQVPLYAAWLYKPMLHLE
jgi:penicillin amidase